MGGMGMPCDKLLDGEPHKAALVEVEGSGGGDDAGLGVFANAHLEEGLAILMRVVLRFHVGELCHKKTTIAIFFSTGVFFCCSLWPQMIPKRGHKMSEEQNTESAIRLRLSAEFKGEIEKAAEAMHISVSALTRMALAEYLRERNASLKTEEAA
jgi:hypothetical protein